MKLRYFLALVFACPSMAGATFERLRAAIETCNPQKFESVMKEIPDTYEGYGRRGEYVYSIAMQRAQGVYDESSFSKVHLSLLRQAFRRVDQVTTEEEKDNAVKILTLLSKKVLKEPFAEDCKPFIVGMLFRAPTEVFFSFRKDPDLNQFIKDNANALYVQAIEEGTPGVSSILREKYGALLPADKRQVQVVYGLDQLGDPDYFSRTPAEHIWMSLFDDWQGHRTQKHTPEDLKGLCEEFTWLYEDFIKGVGRRTRSLNLEYVKVTLDRFLKLPLGWFLLFAGKENIEAEDFLISIENQKTGGGLYPSTSFSIFHYAGYSEEPRMYIPPLREMTDTLKETHFDLFKRPSEETLEKVKSQVDFLDDLNNDANIEEEVLKKSESFQELFFIMSPPHLKELVVQEKKRSDTFLGKFLKSKQKYPDFFARNLDVLKDFYNHLSSDLLKRSGSEMEEKLGSKKVHRIEE